MRKLCIDVTELQDKNPELLLTVVRGLKERGVSFHLHVLGQAFGEVPPVFEVLRAELEQCGCLGEWGYVHSKAEDFKLVSSCDVVLSTAYQEVH